MKNKNILIISVIICLLGINLLLVPYIHRREAIKIVNTVLNLWVEGDLPSAFDHWEDQQKTPPIYDLASFEINQKTFSKKDGIRQAQISATLTFPAGHTLPSGRKWVFELQKTPLGWKIVDCRRVD